MEGFFGIVLFWYYLDESQRKVIDAKGIYFCWINNDVMTVCEWKKCDKTTGNSMTT